MTTAHLSRLLLAASLFASIASVTACDSGEKKASATMMVKSLSFMSTISNFLLIECLRVVPLGQISPCTHSRCGNVSTKT